MHAAARPFPALADGLRYGSAAGLTCWGADFLGRLAAVIGGNQVPLEAYDAGAAALECFLAGLTASAGMLVGAVLVTACGRALARLPGVPSEGPIPVRARLLPFALIGAAALAVLGLALAGQHLRPRQFLVAAAAAGGAALLFSGPLLRRRSRVLAASGPLLLLLGVLIAILNWGWRVMRTPEVLADPGLRAGAVADTGAPDLLLITMDTTRADRLGCYGNERARTPNLDRLAGAGVRYTRAYAPTSSTQPSHASILTGLDMPWHGVRRNNETGLDASVPTVPELLAARGYDTRAVVSAYPLDRSFGFWRGFGYYDDRMPSRFSLGHARREFQRELVRRSVGYRLAQFTRVVDLLSESAEVSRLASETADAALEALESAPSDRPLFLWVHWWDPHGPYDPPASHFVPYPAEPDPPPRGYPFRWGRYPSRADMYAHYDGEIAYMDDELGRLLASFAARGRPQIVFATADHGEGLHEHDVATHGADVFEVTLHVPLLISGHGVPAGRVIETTVSTFDLAPTLLQCGGADLPPDLAARSLKPYDAAAPAAAGDREFYHEATHSVRRDGSRVLNRAWRTGTWKYLHLAVQTGLPAGSELLYRYVDDPQEGTDLARQHPELLRDLLAAMERFSAGFPAGRGVALEQDSGRDANMAELGYADGEEDPTPGE